MASLRVGKYRLSKRLVKDALSDMLGVELSVGSVSNLEGELAQALAPAATDALAFIQEGEAVNADETGFVQGREGGRAGRAWLWVVATARGVVFHIARSRGGKVARHLLGEDFAGNIERLPLLQRLRQVAHRERPPRLGETRAPCRMEPACMDALTGQRLYYWRKDNSLPKEGF